MDSNNIFSSFWLHNRFRRGRIRMYVSRRLQAGIVFIAMVIVFFVSFFAVFNVFRARLHDSADAALQPTTQIPASETTAVREQETQLPAQPQAASQTDTVPRAAAEESVFVYLTNTGTVCGLSVRDYCIGAVAAEMPALYEEQALCAQAAACLNIVRRAVQAGPREQYDGAHITSSPSVDQAYMTPQQLHDRWGSSYETYYKRIAAAVDTVLPYRIVDGEELCVTAFHAISPGRTEESENVWVSDVSYLTAVDSSFDATAPDYYNETQLSAAQFAQGLAVYGFDGSTEPSQWIGPANYSDSGTLLELTVGNITVSGADLRSAFGLHSAAVEVSYADDVFVLATKGYGHGVGMSQYGAQQLALQGKTWQDIIYHYYKGVQIVPQ